MEEIDFMQQVLDKLDMLKGIGWALIVVAMMILICLIIKEE